MPQSLFRPDSVTWRINQEPALLLGGGRALLMQLAHPSVAAGVAEHSDFRRRPLDRLMRTLELTLALTFGSRAEALAAAQQINAVHQRIRGDGYSATDPRLLLWVHATLIDSALVTYTAFVGPLSDGDRDAYYQEAKLIGGLLGLANSRYPGSLPEFDAYLAGMLGGPELLVDARARELARAVLRPNLQRVPPPAFRPLEAITAGLLPASLRLDYDLPWGRLERLGFGAVRGALPRVLRVLPRRFRLVPPARAARARTAPPRTVPLIGASPGGFDVAVESSASATWNGELMGGSGSVRVASGAFPEQTLTWRARAESRESGTSPEELIAAAHAGCFAMALSFGLGNAGHPPERLDTSARVAFQPGAGITGIHLTVRGRVPGLSADAFRDAAEGAKANCPVSKALAGVPEITVEASLEG